MRMHRSTLLAVASLAAAAPAAHADLVTLGSDLSAPAAQSITDQALIEQEGADTAFWPLAFGNSGAVQTPVDGQIVSVKIKGTVFKEAGAADPANMIHFQSLGPAAADGSRKVYLTSGMFYLPIDQPNAITTYEPVNLCIPKGGTWDFNDVGGHMFGGTLQAPVDPNHYIGGARFGVFGLVPGSTTAQYTAGDQTNNGFTLYPSTASQNINLPYGNARQGKELLMQVVIATGDDIGVPCKNNLGIPWTPGGGSTPVVPAAPKPRVMKIRPQASHVTSRRAVGPMIYCPGKGPACAGTGKLLYKGKVIASGKLDGAGPKTLRIPMKLSAKTYRLLRKAKGHTLTVTFNVASNLGSYVRVIKIKA